MTVSELSDERERDFDGILSPSNPGFLPFAFPSPTLPPRVSSPCRLRRDIQAFA
jgi:hypothetical protein